MPACFRCGAETKLYSNEVPVCLRCSDELEKKQQQRAVHTDAEALRKKIEAELLKQVKSGNR